MKDQFSSPAPAAAASAQTEWERKEKKMQKNATNEPLAIGT